MGSTHTGFDSDGMTEEKTLKAQARHTCGWSAVTFVVDWLMISATTVFCISPSISPMVFTPSATFLELGIGCNQPAKKKTDSW